MIESMRPARLLGKGVKVGVSVHDGRRFAAQFHDAGNGVGRRITEDRLASGHRAGEDDLVDLGTAHQMRSDLTTAARTAGSESMADLVAMAESLQPSDFSATETFADDLEIYLGSADEQVTYDPNVLFIMDTSGSMGSKDGGTESRMLRVQNALKDALEDLANELMVDIELQD